MAPSSKITLTVAGDSTGVRKALVETEAAAAHAGTAVSKSSKHIGEALESVGAEARASSHLMRGMGEASALMGGEMGAAASNIEVTLQATRSLSKGAGELIGRVGLLRVGLIGLGVAAAGLAIEGTKNQQGWANLGNDVWKPLAYQLSIADAVVEKLPGHLGFLGSALDGVTNSARVHAGMSQTDAAAMREQADAAAGAANAMHALHEQMLFQAPDQNPGGDAFVTALDMQNINIQAYADQSGETWNNYVDSLPKVASGIRSGGSSIAKAIDTAAQAQKDKLARWQGIADQFSNVAKGIQDSLGPKLVAGIASPLLLAKGTTVLDNLKKQLKDTLHLKSDLAKLSKMGLGNDLLESLTAGGLDSLGSADEILAGGQAGVNAVNHTAAQITAAGGSIAGADAARQFADSLKKPIKVELHVGKGGDDVLDKWLQKALKTKGAKFYGLKAA